MRAAILIVLVAALLAIGNRPAAAQQAETAAELAARIDRLILQLDDDNFAVREKAEAALAEIGEPAREKLTAAAKDAAAERNQRATKLLAALRRSSQELRHLATIQHSALVGAVTAALAPDGEFLYVPAFNANSITAFRRDAVTGGLAHASTLTDAGRLDGVVTLRLSPDGKRAVSAAYRSKTIALLSRDAKSGELTIDSVAASDPAVGLEMVWPIDAVFSADGNFVYAVDDRAATVIAFRIEDGKRLTLVEVCAGQDRCFDGARGIVAHPDNKTLYVNSQRPGIMAVLDRDPASGKLGVRQLVRDEQDGVKGLAGTTGAIVSRDGKFVYTISGRFAGDNSVGVYQVGADGKLTVLQEFMNGEGELKDLTGPNDFVLSRDGTSLYVSGTTSCSLASFRRDPASGKLTYVATLQNEATGAGSDLGANGIDISADGRYLYLVLENGGAVSSFERLIKPRLAP